MNQSALEIDTSPATLPADPRARTGFEIGWDHARHALVPPAELLLADTPVGHGWLAGKAVFGGRAQASARPTRAWLLLRTEAWRRGLPFDCRQLTPQALESLRAARCPVLRTPLGGAPGQPDAAVYACLDPRAGFVAGNVALLSLRAAQAHEGVDVLEALRRARRLEAGAPASGGLDAPAWWRLAVLQSFATPLPFHEVARLPLALLPPHGVRLRNAAQALQSLLTLQFASPGWSARTRAVAELLPEHTLRHDYNLFVGAYAPRVLEAGREPADLQQALADAWLHERVQRRWQHWLLSLGEAATGELLQRVVAIGSLRAASPRPLRGSGGTRKLQAPGTGSGAPPSVAVGCRLSQPNCAWAA